MAQPVLYLAFQRCSEPCLQRVGLVPIVEPELLIDGAHTIEQFADASEHVISRCVAHMWQKGEQPGPACCLILPPNSQQGHETSTFCLWSCAGTSQVLACIPERCRRSMFLPDRTAPVSAVHHSSDVQDFMQPSQGACLQRQPCRHDM